MPNTPLKPIDATKPLLTVTQAAQVAGYSRATMYRLVKTAPKGSALHRAIVAIDGAQLRIRRHQLEIWLTGDVTAPAA